MQPAISEPELVSPEPASITQPSDSSTRGIARAASVIALGNVASRVLGLARETVKSHLFGATWHVDAFQISSIVPLQLYDLLIGGMISSALVPVFSEYAAPERREELERLAGTLFTLAAITLAVLVLVAEGLTPLIAWLLGSGFDAKTLALAADLLRITLPAVMFLSLSGLLTGLLYALKRFTLPAFTSAVFNASVVVSAVLFSKRFGVASMALGILTGGIVQIALQAPGLRGLRLRLALDWHHPALRRVARLYMPVAASLIISQVAIYLSVNLASHAGEGSLAWMNYATTLIQFPLGLVSAAISMAILPTLSRQSASDSVYLFLATLAHGLKLVLMLMIPATVGLFVLAHPIVALVFQHGEFTPQDTVATAQLLRLYLFGLTFAAIDQPLIFAFYARKDTLTPARRGIGLHRHLSGRRARAHAGPGPTAARLRPGAGELDSVDQSRTHHAVAAQAAARRVERLWRARVDPQSSRRLSGDGRDCGADCVGADSRSRGISHTGGNLIIVGGAGLAAVLVYGALMVILRVQELDVLRQLVTGTTGLRNLV